MPEEDMALANMGLDLLGQARELYSYAAKVENNTREFDPEIVTGHPPQPRVWTEERSSPEQQFS